MKKYKNDCEKKKKMIPVARQNISLLASAHVCETDF